jgi:hypothetical protein
MRCQMFLEFLYLKHYATHMRTYSHSICSSDFDVTSKLDALHEEDRNSLLPLYRINEDLEKQKVSSYRALLDEK